MGNEIIKGRITSILKTGIYYMINQQYYLIEIKKGIKESIIDSSNNISFVSLRPSSYISDSFSFNQNNCLIKNLTITIHIDLQKEFYIIFYNEIFLYSFIILVLFVLLL